ncbi:uncharacterized protein PRCAT00000484001 [Priceomyces carsonii]|uniref:uncharacterized protein n=1 Tax=Priceomyces carsonii TaxID=28549 RepID=UPI002EDB7553|nr:unnamed protein product [Priceomyces carsonii]
MGRMNRTEFITELTSILQNNEGKSSVYLTQKRLSDALLVDDETSIHDLSSNVISENNEFKENTEKYSILIRVSMNTKAKKQPKVKLSTVVDVDNLEVFWNEYSQALKAGFMGLKKKEKKKVKKSKISK